MSAVPREGAPQLFVMPVGLRQAAKMIPDGLLDLRTPAREPLEIALRLLGKVDVHRRLAARVLKRRKGAGAACPEVLFGVPNVAQKLTRLPVAERALGEQLYRTLDEKPAGHPRLLLDLSEQPVVRHADRSAQRSGHGPYFTAQ